jgi:deoxyribonuclease V
MEFALSYEWPTTPHEASAIIDRTIPDIVIDSNTVEPRLIAAVETDYRTGGEILYAGAVIATFPELRQVERALYYARVTFPYHPGLLFFREGEVIVNALAKLRSDVDLIIVSGHGLAHPQLCGVACHVGVALDKPTIGCARRLLAGQHRPLDETKGSMQPIMLRGHEVGLAYRSKDGVKPIFISPAHRCDLAFARDIILRSVREYRQPEPLRFAHLEANKYRRRSEQRHGPIPPPEPSVRVGQEEE